MPFSHLDFFWGGTREECLARGNRIIAKAVRLANRQPEFRFLVEDQDFVANYVESHKGSPGLEDLRKLVKEGRIELAPKWAEIFQGLPSGEVHVRNLAYGKRYARTVFGVDPLVCHLTDVPDFTPQYPQMLARASVPYAVMTRMGPKDKSIFRWRAPDGSEALTWNALKHYGWGTFLGRPGTGKIAHLQKDLDDVRPTAAGPIFMNWGTDLWTVPDDLVQSIHAVNQEQSFAKLIFATPLDFFRRVAKQPNLPEVSGEIPSSWPNIVASLPHMWPLQVPATNTLVSAEKFAALNYALGYADYPRQELEFLWKKLIESMDHNHDGQGGSAGDDRKIGYSQLALLHGGEILRDSLRNIAERVEIPVKNSFPIVVFNAMGWTRDDLVDAHVSLFGDVSPGDIQEFRNGLRLVDETGSPAPFHVVRWSENISRAVELTFVARAVPSLGYRTYYVTAGTAETSPETARVKLDDDADRRDPRRPLGSDVVENSFYRVTIDRATGRVAIFDKELNQDVAKDLEIVAAEERGGNYIGIEPLTGRIVPESIDGVTIEENNEIRAVVRIEGRIADIPIVQRLTLYAGLKRVDIENTVEWSRPRFLRLEQLFPVAHANAEIRYGVPFGANLSTNIMPNSGTTVADEIKDESWREVRHIQDWIHAGGSDWGVTLSTDHQFVRLGKDAIRGEMLRGVRFTSVKVVSGEQIGSLNYPPPGTYKFRYSLSSSRGDWKAARVWQRGLNFNNPLLPVEVVDEISRKSLEPTHSFLSLEGANLVLSAVKKSDLENAVLVRFYEIAGAPAETRVQFLGRNRDFREVNLLEEESGAAGQLLKIKPYEIRTVKVQ